MLHSLANEQARLEALHALDILDSDPEPGFDAMTRLAAGLFNTPISVVSLIDAERQWFKSCVGIDGCETSREDSMCDHAICFEEGLVLLDARADPRFRDHPAVAPEDGIRFYAGAPVRFNGTMVGTLCVADTEPRDGFSADDRLRLRTMADAVSSMMEMRKDGLIKKEIIRSKNETQAKLEMAETIAEVGHWHFDIAGRALDWSAGVYRILGLEPHAFPPTADAIAPFYHPDDWPMVRAHMAAAALVGRPFDYEARIIRPDGEQRRIAVEGTVERDEDGRPMSVFGVLQDITERKRVEDALREAKRSAEAFATAKADFLSDMSHEIRTPLTTIIGYSGILAEMGELPDNARTYAARLQRNGKTLLTLVNDVLDYAKLEAGQVELDPVEVGVTELVSEVVDQFAALAEAKGVELQVDVARTCPTELSLDPVRLTQVLNNFVSNAVKFTAAGHVRVAVSGIEDGGRYRLRLEVHDTGPGIPADQQERLFRRFAQADAGVTRRHGGTGLGLSICLEIARLMEGAVGCQSVEGQGSCFWFEGLVDHVTAQDQGRLSA